MLMDYAFDSNYALKEVTIPSSLTYIGNLLINVVEDGSFDDQLISLAKDEGLSIDTIIMLEDVKTERVEYTPVLVSVEESTKNESSRSDTPLQVGVAIGSFFFFVLVLSLFYYFFVVSKVRRIENVVNNHVAVSREGSHINQV